MTDLFGNGPRSTPPQRVRDARGFKVAIDQFVRDAEKSALGLVREVALQAFTGIVQASPVGNATRWEGNVKRAAKGLPPLPKGYVGGHFRKNWQLTINAGAAGEVAGTDPTGAEAINGAVSQLLGVTDLSRVRTIHIGNRLPYADPIEDGWSKQAPAGVVGPTKAAIEARYGGRR